MSLLKAQGYAMRMRHAIDEDLNKRGKGHVISAPFFDDYTTPEGFLAGHPACHALFYYNAVAHGTYERTVVDPMYLEGQLDEQPVYDRLFASIAIMYNVEPETMVQFWPDVAMQCSLLQMPVMPDEDRYRHNKPMAAKLIKKVLN